jgi:ketosteroid isomerase-like protein/predicted aspartyl protease
MGTHFFSGSFALLVLCGAAAFGPSVARAQEIPLKHCDALPVVEVTIGNQPMLFLVDTAATSMLNLNSFTTGKAQGTRVTSWTGTLATSGREVTLDEVTVGNTKLMKLELLAIDLSAIGKACGRKIDGVLGMDLLAKLGATIDMKRQLMHVATVSETRSHGTVAEMMGEMHRCLYAFNESDEKAFAECLDPKIVLFTAGAELYGREQTLGYFRERYFHQKPAAHLEISESAFHPIGDAIWYEYEFSIESTRGVLRGRGMAMCRKSEGHWRMASMHHSIVEFEPAAVEGGSR